MNLNYNFKDIDPDYINPLVWAYIGDAVYELYIRTLLVSKGIIKVNKLHCESIKYVKASAQADFIKKIANNLTDEELRIIKRGRNTKSTVPRNASASDYRYSTGFEGLIGYLYLKNKNERILEIFQMLDIEEKMQEGSK